MRVLRAAAGFAAVLVLVGGCAPSPHEFDGHTEGTTYHITVAGLPTGVSPEAMQAAIDGVLAQVDQHLSTWNPASEITAFNANRSLEPIPVSRQLRAIAEVSRRVSEASGGAFDITVAPLVRAWGFANGVVPGRSAGRQEPYGAADTVEEALSMPQPDAGLLAATREHVGYEKLLLPKDGTTLQKTTPELELDVAGVAPGYAVDLIAERFEALGVRDYLIELGGELRGRGRSPAGRPWRVAVEAPLSGVRKPYALVELDGMSASTSGDYRDFHYVGGRRVSHTIDPRTAAPVAHGPASVCVVHRSAAYADAWATALMVLGPEEGLSLARREKLAALFIERDPSGTGFREQSTPEFERLRRPLD